MIRGLLERFSAGIVIKRRLPAEFNYARILVTPDAALSYWKPGLTKRDPRLLAIVRQHVKSGDVVWDIGANVGLFSIAAAQLAGPSGFVLAVEPDIWLAQLIRRSTRLSGNRHLKVQVLTAAISDSPGIAMLAIAARGRASNALEITGHRSQAGGTRERQIVPTLTLDLLAGSLPVPTLVKIDVEGAELLVLRGASQLLSDIRPIVHCEVGEHHASKVTDILRSAGYKLYDGDEPPQRRTELDTCRWNTLAYPT